jgi:hypothetical protein
MYVLNRTLPPDFKAALGAQRFAQRRHFLPLVMPYQRGYFAASEL